MDCTRRSIETFILVWLPFMVCLPFVDVFRTFAVLSAAGC
jgi:hypothetical protein